MGNPMSFVDLDGREPEDNFEPFLLPPDSEPQTVPDLNSLFDISVSPENNGTIFDNFPFTIDPDLTDDFLHPNENTQGKIISGQTIEAYDEDALLPPFNKDIP